MNPFDAVKAPLESEPPTPPKKPAEIVVMPEKYYGVALKMDARESDDGKTGPAMPTPPPPPKPKVVVVSASPDERKSPWSFVALGLACVLLIIGGFVFYNRKTLFQKPVPIVVAPTSTQPVVKNPPTPPADLRVSAPTGTQSVQLLWQDTSNNETGFRVERAGSDGVFSVVTNVPTNSGSFLDVSVQPGQTYRYRITAQNEAGVSTPTSDGIVIVPVKELVLPTLPPGGLDSDSDGLSDSEELVFSTDARNPDSDGDGFLDGNEVFHFYNPAQKAPLKLTDTTLVTPFKGSLGWSMWIPSTWSSSLSIADGQKAKIMTGQGEQFDIEVIALSVSSTAKEWYLAQHPTTTASMLREWTTKQGLQGLLSPDRMTALFQWGNNVFVMKYQQGTKPFINYRTIYEMMLNSITLEGAPTITVTPGDSVLDGPGDVVGIVEKPVATPTSTATATTPLVPLPTTSTTNTSTTP